MEKRKIIRRRSRTSDYADIGHITFLFCRGRQSLRTLTENLFLFFFVGKAPAPLGKRHNKLNIKLFRLSS